MSALEKSRRGMRVCRYAAIAAASGLTFATAGCGGMAAGSSEGAQVRFVDLSANAPAMDLYLDGSGAAYGLSFGTVTSYIPVAPGELKVQAARANTQQMLGSTVGNLNGAHTYTVVASNAFGSLQEMIYPDAGGPAPAREVAFRVLNEDADSGPLDVYLLPSTSALGVGMPATVRGVGYKDASSYVDVAAGPAYAVAVTAAGVPPTASTVLHGLSVSGGSGAVRTLVLSRTLEPGEKGLAGFVLNDYDAP